MKKIILGISLLLIVALAACGAGDKEKSGGTDGKKEITIGASSEPHAEILEQAKPILKDKGIKLTIKPYQDYVLPNDDLDNGKLDANYFQHIPYLEQTKEDTGYKLDHIGNIHIEPMGVYSKDIKSIDDIKKGTEVIMSNSVSDHGRVLTLFEEQGLIKLKDGVNKDKATTKDITENAKNLKFTADSEPAFLPELYNSEKNVLVAINTNFAIDAGLNPRKDALFIEKDDSPYVNVIAVRSEDKDNKTLHTLVDVLHSKKIQDFIKEKYKGAVVPVKEK